MRLNPPRWPTSIALAAAMAALACFPVWPGFMSPDSLFAYREGLEGVTTPLWPPLHAYLFAVSRAAGFGAGGVLVFQVFGLFLGAALILHMLGPGGWRATALGAAFAGLFALVPALLGPLVVHWRDVLAATFTVLGLAAWLLGGASRRPWLPVAALVGFALTAAIRFNGLPLVAPLMAAVAWRPYLQPGSRRALSAGLVVVAIAGLAVAWASTVWRLPDLHRLPAPRALSATQEFDLIGISVCAGRTYLPPAATAGAPISAGQLARVYDPRNFLDTITPRRGTPRLYWIAADPSTPMMWRYSAERSDTPAALRAAWLHAVRTEPGCYLRHRWRVFAEVMGIGRSGVFYPINDTIDPNDLGLALARPDAAAVLSGYVEALVNRWPQRPIWLYPAALLLGAAAVWRDRSSAVLFGPLLAGAFLYPWTLFLAAPAAEGRYIFPSSVLCALAITAAVAVLWRGRVEGD